MSAGRRIAARAARATLTRVPDGVREVALAMATRAGDGPALMPGPPVGAVLVVAPHPDDETIGAGGAIGRHVDAGDAVMVLVVTSGEATSGGGGDVAATREAECRAACADLGVTREPVFLRLEDGNVAAAVDRLADEIRTHGQDAATVYVPSVLDPHADHRAANVALARAGLAAVVHGYEVWSAGPVDVLIDVASVYARKERALRRYVTALEAVDYVRVCRGLAQYRSAAGGLGGAGLAEGFTRMDAATHSRWTATATAST